MINLTIIVQVISAIILTILAGMCMYSNLVDPFYEEFSFKHKRFWFCQFITALAAITIYLTKLGIIGWK
jgi:hypothetical protein